MATATLAGERPRTVTAEVNYVIDTGRLEAFHANDQSLDTVRLDRRTVTFTDARRLSPAPRLEVNGFELFSVPSAVEDWRDDGQVQGLYPAEIQAFIKRLTGADAVASVGRPSLRWGERSAEIGSRDNSRAARLIHSDAARAASADFVRMANPHPDRKIVRAVHHNIWRAFSGPPIDVPLALCDARTVDEADIVEALANFDQNGVVTWSFAAMTFRHNPAHRWMFFSDMTPDEVLVFKQYDTGDSAARFVPHTAFTDPVVGAEGEPRASIETRTLSFWYA
jgi:hypothetical protein